MAREGGCILTAYAICDTFTRFFLDHSRGHVRPKRQRGDWRYGYRPGRLDRRQSYGSSQERRNGECLKGGEFKRRQVCGCGIAGRPIRYFGRRPWTEGLRAKKHSRSGGERVACRYSLAGGNATELAR